MAKPRSDEAVEKRRAYARAYYRSHPPTGERLERKREATRRHNEKKRLLRPPKPVRGPDPESRACTQCLEVKSLSLFHKQRGSLYGRRAICNACDYKKECEYRQKPEVRARRQARQRAANARLSPEKKAAKRDYLRRWKETYVPSEEQRERNRQATREWHKKNRPRMREHCRRYEAKKRAVTIGVVSYDRILDRDGLHCYLCNTAVAVSELSFDHVVPLSRDGAHTEDNIRVVHAVCNSRKRNRLLSEIKGDWLRLVA